MALKNTNMHYGDELYLSTKICNKDVALETTLRKTVLILIRICLFFRSCCKLFSACANPSIFQIVGFSNEETFGPTLKLE